MAAKETKPVRPAFLAADSASLAALKSIEKYAPANPAYKVKALVKAEADVRKTGEALAKAEAQLKTVRDRAVAAQWAFHNAMVEARKQVAAQFGPDSDEIQAVGLKKASERKTPKRKAKKTETA
jgi:hypothetical protein